MKRERVRKIDMLARGLKPLSELAEGRPHGDRLRYMAGCKCMLCRAANSRYQVEREAARKRGEWNGLVDARKARNHLLKLQRAGIGRRTISDISGICQSQIVKIRSGQRRHVRALTEANLLAVTTAATNDARLIPAAPTWALLRKLMTVEGFTEQELAQRLGYKNPVLQIRTDRITAKTAAKVERFYNRLMLAE
jgi:hypothetical protein